jgi:hypothetical protein
MSNVDVALGTTVGPYLQGHVYGFNTHALLNFFGKQSGFLWGGGRVEKKNTLEFKRFGGKVR